MTHFRTISRLVSSVSLAIAISISSLTGCAIQDDPNGSTVQNQLSENQLSENQLSENQLSENQLSENQLSENNLAVENLASTADGRELLTYVAKCALPAGQDLSVTVNGATHVFPGLLGIAPEWSQNALGNSKREAMSGCLMAHVNHFGESVPISVRNSLLPAADSQEQASYPLFEGAFFGNLFHSPSEKYACSGDAFDPNTAGWRNLRACTDVETGSTTFCGFTYVGACSDVCSVSADGAYQTCSAGGQNFTAPTSTYLID